MASCLVYPLCHNIRFWKQYTQGTADRGTCRAPEPAEPYRNREISRLPKLRALGNVEVFGYYSNLSLMSANVTLFSPIVELRFSPLERGRFAYFCSCFRFLQPM